MYEIVTKNSCADFFVGIVLKLVTIWLEKNRTRNKQVASNRSLSKQQKDTLPQ